MRTVFYILFGSGFTVGVSYAAGTCVFRFLGFPRLSKLEKRLFSFLAGAAVVSLVVFVVCVAHLVYKGVFLALGLGCIGIAVRFRRSQESTAAPSQSSTARILLGLTLVTFGVFYFVNALAPEVSPDGAAYHLAFVTRYQHWRGFRPVTTNLYANMPQGMEMLFLFAFVFGRHSSAALVHLSFLFALALLLWSFGLRRNMPRAGLFAAFIVFASPLFGIDAASAYNDAALAAVTFGCFYSLELWLDSQELERQARGALILAGLLAGFAYAIKQTGACVFLYAVGFLIAVRAKKLRAAELIALLLPAALVALPWIVRSYLVTGNPVSPFFNQLFPNPYIHISFEKSYGDIMRQSGLIGSFPLSLVWDGAAGGTFGPAFVLLPFGLLALRTGVGRRLWITALVFAAMYPLNTGSRFLMSAAPLVALAIGAGIAWAPLLYAAAFSQLLFAWPAVLNRVRAPTCWNLSEFPFRAALRLEPEEAFIHRRMPYYDMARFIEKTVPAGARVLALDPIAEAYTTKTVIVSYESAEGERETDTLLTPVLPTARPDRVVVFTFPEQRVQRALLQQVAAASSDLFSINEISMFDREKAASFLSREIYCEPFHWDSALAADGDLTTRWNSWQALSPAMYCQLTLPSAPEIDQVEVRGASRLQSNVRLRLTIETASGLFQVGAPMVIANPLPVDLRRKAVASLKRSGTEFLMVPDQSRWASEFFDHRDDWGIRFVGEWGRGRLYGFE